MKSILLAVIMTKAMLGCSGPKAMEYKSPKLGPYYMTQIDKVYDGDTVKAEGHDIEIKVRLVGIDELWGWIHLRLEVPQTARRS